MIKSLILKAIFLIGCAVVLAIVFAGFLPTSPLRVERKPAAPRPSRARGWWPQVFAALGLVVVGAVAIWMGPSLRVRLPFGRAMSTAHNGPRELWLSDFETDNEPIVRWKAEHAVIEQSSEHAAHGRRCAKVTFREASTPKFIMDTYLARDRNRRNWAPYSTLEFDVYNAQASQERVMFSLKDQDQRAYKEELYIPGRTTQHVTIRLADLKAFLDVSQIAECGLFQWKPNQTTTFFVDAFHLVAASPSADDATAPLTALALSAPLHDAALSPDALLGLAFAQRRSQWAAVDPVSGGPVMRVPLAVVGPAMPLSEAFPLSGGVPFPMGELKSPEPVRLIDSGGARWPVQSRPLATWEDGSVKWLQVTTQVPADANGRALLLVYGKGLSAEVPAGPAARVQENADAVLVTTGPLRFSVSKRRFTLFEWAEVDRNGDGTFSQDERLAGAGDLVLTHEGTEFRSSQDAETYQLSVEENGPQRVTLKASGWFRDQRGKGFCQFIVRLQAFAGLPQVRVFHTVIYTGYPANHFQEAYRGAKLPDNETIQAMSLELPVTVASGAMVLMGGDEDVLSWPLTQRIDLAQSAHDAFRVEREGADVPVKAGEHGEGWLLMQDARAGVMVSVRDFWQQYPKELVADPAGRLVVKLWPESAGPLNLETTAEAYGPESYGQGSAFGLAKTHELTIGFLGAAIDGRTAQALAGLWQEPWLLAADPRWLFETNALGTIGPTQPRPYLRAELMLDGLFAWAIRQPKAFGWYGMLDYGDTLTWYRKEAYDKSYDDWGWHKEGRWGWHACEAAGTHTGALISFLRARHPDYFRFAEAKARHVMDVDTVHYNTVANDVRLKGRIPDTFSQVGSMHRHNANHWGGENEEASHTNVLGVLLYYYLTGYDRAWDVANEVGEFLLRDSVTYSGRSDMAPSRAISNVLWGDVLLYQATHDRRFREAAERWVRILLAGQSSSGEWPANYDPRERRWYGESKHNFTAFHVLPALIAYHRLTGNEAVAHAILKGTDALIANEQYADFFDALAYSFLLTGKKTYLEEGLRRVQELVLEQHHGDDATMDGMVFEKALYDHVATVLYSVPWLLGALEARDFPTLMKSVAPAPPTSSAAERGAYDVLVMDSTEKVLPERGVPASAHRNPVHLSLARNESEAAQIVLASATALHQVTLEPGDLQRSHGEGAIPRSAITWSPVEFVKTKQPGYPVPHVGWWPDPLPGSVPFEVKPNWPQPIWLTVHAAADTPPGEYVGTVTIHPADGPATPVQVIVNVWDFTLPVTPTLKTAFDVYPSRIRSAYQQSFPQWWSRWESKPQELLRRFYDDLVAHRLAPVLNLDLSRPDDAAALRHLTEHGLSAFAVGGHGGSFDNNWPADGAQLEQLQPRYRGWAYDLRSAGALDRHYIYTYDEPPPGLPKVAQVARMIHDADPGLNNLVTLMTAPDVDAFAAWFHDIDIVALHNATFDPAQAQKLQTLGKELWLYIAGPSFPSPTLVIDYPGMAARILPWMCWKYGLKGLLYWCVNFWTTNPYENPMNTPWQQNGNGSLYYPGPQGPVPSIRLELLRDGMEDYEYLHRLSELLTAAKSRADIDPALVARAEQLLTVNPTLVESMRVYAKDAATLLAQREAIAEMIEQLQHLLRQET